MNTDFESKHARNTDGTFKNMHKVGASTGIAIAAPPAAIEGTAYDHRFASTLEAKAFAQAAIDLEDRIAPQVADLLERDTVHANPTEIGYDFTDEQGNVLCSCDTYSSDHPVQFYDEEDGFGWEWDEPVLAAQTYAAIELRRLQRQADQPHRNATGIEAEALRLGERQNLLAAQLREATGNPYASLPADHAAWMRHEESEAAAVFDEKLEELDPEELEDYIGVARALTDEEKRHARQRFWEHQTEERDRDYVADALWNANNEAFDAAMRDITR